MTNASLSNLQTSIGDGNLFNRFCMNVEVGDTIHGFCQLQFQRSRETVVHQLNPTLLNSKNENEI